MEEVKDVVMEKTSDTEEVTDMGGLSNDAGDSENSEESSTEKTEGADKTGKVEKTASEDVSSEEGQDDEVKDDGKPIPYERFKKVIDQKNTFKTKHESLKAESEQMAELLNKPEVFRAVLQAQGITDPKVLSEKMKEAGFDEGKTEEIPEEKLFEEFAKGLDLSKTNNWGVVMARMAKHFAGEATKPIMGKMSKQELQTRMTEMETEAKKIAKDTYNLEYGDVAKDGKNMNTAVGKMTAYLDKHPEDAGLGHVKILRLALAEEGIKLGEQKGIKKEKERNRALKDSAMEDDAQVGKDEVPNGDWPVSKILAYRRKYGK